MTLIAVLLFATIGINTVWAIGAGIHNPLERFELKKRVNKSPHPDVKVKLIPKSYGYGNSKVCGQVICGYKTQQSFKHNTQIDNISTNWKDFDGHVKIKGYFPKH